MDQNVPQLSVVGTIL